MRCVAPPLRPMNCIRMRGKKSTPHRDPSDPPSRRATKRTGHGTSASDRPPIISVVSRETGEHRFWVCDHADRRTCRSLLAEHVPAGSTRPYTNEWQSYRGSHPFHATVRHGVHEWARDDDADGRREGHCNTCEGAGAGLRTYLRVFRGVHKQHLHLYVATYDAMLNTKRVTPMLIQRMCVCNLSAYSGYT
jgi:transposase-like protein